MIHIENKSLIFISVPKTGSTSIMIQLDRSSGHQKPKDYHSRVCDLTPDLARNNSVALFHRHPLERFASTFYDGIKCEGHKSIWSKPLLPYKDNFKQFCLDFKNLEISKDIHFAPQWSFVENDFPQTKIICFSYEHWREEIARMNEVFGLSLDPNVEERRSNRPSTDEIFDEESKKEIEEFYHIDYQVFGYSKV